ncbi:PucR family transcriptional regulator [Streptomyces sp. NPDC001221]
MNNEQRGHVLDHLALGEIAAQLATALVREIAAYREQSAQQLETDLLTVLHPIFAMLRAGREATVKERAAFSDFGALRAEMGIALESLLEGFRLTTRRTFDTLYDKARRAATPEVGLELTRDFWVCCDQMFAAMVQGHRERELEKLHAAEQHRTLLLRQLLTGELPVEYLAAAADMLGLDLHAEYRVCHSSGGTAAERALRPHTVALLAEPAPQRVIGLAVGPLPASLGLPVGLSEPRPLSRARASLAEAEQASELAVAFGIRRCVTAGELPLHSAVLALPTVGEQLVTRCFGHLTDERRTTAVHTVDTYLAADANIDQAAAALFIHPNTLRYRLRALTAATGLDPARTEDSLTLWWAVRYVQAVERAR